MAERREENSSAGILPSKIHPKRLHGSSRDHVWAFGAIAELIDNAYDPDVDAKKLYIYKEIIDGQSCLVFSDNGNGMDKDKLLNMLSFGYCDKDNYNDNDSHMSVGSFGIGFKSGSMRLGKDAIVFTPRHGHGTACIGLLSQTYLQGINADSILVPILEYTLPKPIMQLVQSVNQNNLDAFLKYSPFKTEAALKAMLTSFESYKSGTKIIIYNLNRLEDGSEELDFESDPQDIRCPQAFARYFKDADNRPTEYVPEFRQSLRAYCSILYFKPKMKIFIREQVVMVKCITRMLHETRTMMPKTEGEPIQIVFGFSCEKDSKQNYGFLMYHKNRLIKAYEKVGCQNENNNEGVGVIGVVELDFLKTVQNKQNFIENGQYNTVLKTLSDELTEYWNRVKGSNSIDKINKPDWIWAQCDICLKWRRLLTGTDPKSIPDKFVCHMNKDAMYNRCSAEEEADHLETTEERNGHTPGPRKTPGRKAAKRHYNKSTHDDGINSIQPTPGCSKDPDELVDDVLNNSTAKKPYQGNVLNQFLRGNNEKNPNNLNTELEEAREELQSSDIPINATVPCSIGNGFSCENYLKETDAPASCFYQSARPPVNEFIIGMKLEAKDPRNESSSCIATVINIQGPRLCLRLDFNGDQNDFWRLVDSSDLHPVGYCEQNKQLLLPPLGFQCNLERWPNLLLKTLNGATLAPENCFKKEPLKPERNTFQVSQKLEAVDRKHHVLICPATIDEIKEDEIHITFDGYPGVYDYWCRYDSRDIFPVGWCKRSGHELLSPNVKDNETRIGSNTNGLTRFHKQVHTLLKLMKPETDIGKEADIENIVDKLIIEHPASS